jgi:hypothetical protein
MTNKAKRPARIPMAAGENLGTPVPKEEGYSYRWFEGNNKGRVEKALAAWWEPVKDENGTAITRPSGAYHMHLMRIDQSIYNEAQEDKQDKVFQFLEDKAKIGKGEYSSNGSDYAVERNGDFDPVGNLP